MCSALLWGAAILLVEGSDLTPEFLRAGTIYRTQLKIFYDVELDISTGFGSRSGVFLRDRDFSSYLGGVERDPETGRITSARSTYMRWFGQADIDEILRLRSEGRDGEARGMDNQPVDAAMLEFEADMLDVLEDAEDYPEGLRSWANVQRSFGDVSTATVWGDVSYLIVGYMLVYCYVVAMLGKFNRVEQRAFLAGIGIFNCFLASVSSFGLCSLFGLDFGSMHTIIPCLLIGLGVDDIFVIVQSLDNINKDDNGNKSPSSIPTRVAAAMRKAGVGITVTSVTDVTVFGIGATTVLPSLRSYSLYTMTGILLVYLLQSTLFVACLALDQARIEARRDGACCWVKHGEDWQPNKFSQRNFLQEAFHKLGTLLAKTPVRIFVMATFLALLGVGCWGVSLLDVEFQYLEFLPRDSKLYLWFAADAEYFPRDGEIGTVYLATEHLHTEVGKLHDLAAALSSRPDLVTSVDSWTGPLADFVDSAGYTSVLSPDLSSEFFSRRLTQFLFSETGAAFVRKFAFEGGAGIECGQPAPPVALASFDFVHPNFASSQDSINAMTWVKDRIAERNFSGRAFAVSQAYSRWEIDQIIWEELFRNLLLAAACVFASTLLLLADLWSSTLVIACVGATLVDVCGLLHFWGLSVDVVVAVNVIIAVGLSVDFSAHVAHTFMTQKGSRSDRATSTLSTIGPAVLNGGASTLVAVVMLASSESHVFVAFFRIFLLMVVLGLAHGLVVLPVVLGVAGPRSYAHSAGGEAAEAAVEAASHELEELKRDDIENKPEALS